MNTNELIPKAEDKIVCVKVGKIKRELESETRKSISCYSCPCCC